MPIYKIDLPGENGDLYVRYKIKDNGYGASLKIKEQRIKWSSKKVIEDAEVSGTGNNETFSLKVVFKDGAWAIYTGEMEMDGTGKGNAEFSWQGKYDFKIQKMPKGTTFEDLLK